MKNKLILKKIKTIYFNQKTSLSKKELKIIKSILKKILYSKEDDN